MLKRLVAALGVMLLMSGSVQALPMDGVTLRISMGPQLAPISFIQEDFTHPHGLDVDIMDELSKRLGFKLYEDRYFILDRATSIEFLKAGKLDIISGGLSATEERRQIMDFSDVYYRTGLGFLYCRSFHEKLSLSETNGLKIAVTRNSPAQAYLSSLAGGKFELVPIANLTLGFFMVASGQVDAIVHDFPPISYFAKTMPALNLAVSPELFSLENGRIALGWSKDFKWKDEFNRGLQSLVRDGTMTKLIVKWIRNNGKVPQA